MVTNYFGAYKHSLIFLKLKDDIKTLNMQTLSKHAKQ